MNASGTVNNNNAVNGNGIAPDLVLRYFYSETEYFSCGN